MDNKSHLKVTNKGSLISSKGFQQALIFRPCLVISHWWCPNYLLLLTLVTPPQVTVVYGDPGAGGGVLLAGQRRPMIKRLAPEVQARGRRRWCGLGGQGGEDRGRLWQHYWHRPLVPHSRGLQIFDTSRSKKKIRIKAGRGWWIKSRWE